MRDKNIADALNDIAKAKGEKVTFTPRAKERELAKKIAELSEKERSKTKEDGNNKLPKKVMEILGLNKGGANEESCFVWYGAVFADEIGTAGQAYNVMNNICLLYTSCPDRAGYKYRGRWRCGPRS